MPKGVRFLFHRSIEGEALSCDKPADFQSLDHSEMKISKKRGKEAKIPRVKNSKP